MAGEVEKVIRYKIRLDENDLNQAADRIGRKQATQQNAQARGRQQQQAASGPSYPATPRTRRPSAPGQQQSGGIGIAGAINNMAGAINRANQGFRAFGTGQNSFLGQAIRGFGFGGTSPLGNFFRFGIGNTNLPLAQRLLGRAAAGGRYAGAARTLLMRHLGSAAMRGAGGAMFGPGGAAMAGSAAAVAGMAGIYGTKLLVSHLNESLHEAATGVKGFAKTFVTGNVSHAMHGAVSMGQGIARFGAGAIGGSLGAIAGGALGSIVGPVGTVGGALLGAGLGATLWGKIASGLLGVAHKFIDGLDSLVANLGKFSPIVAAQARMFEVKTMLFQRQLAFAFQPVMSGWLKLKSVFIDILSKLVPIIKPLIDRVGNAISKFADHFPRALAGLLGGLSKVISQINTSLSYVGLGSQQLQNLANGLVVAAGAVLAPGSGLDAQQKAFNSSFVASIRGAKAQNNPKYQNPNAVSPYVPNPGQFNGGLIPAPNPGKPPEGYRNVARWLDGGAMGGLLGGDFVPIYNKNSPYFKDQSPEDQEWALKHPKSEQLDPDRDEKYKHGYYHGGMVPTPVTPMPGAGNTAPPVIVPGPDFSFRQTVNNRFDMQLNLDDLIDRTVAEVRRTLLDLREKGAAETTLASAMVTGQVRGYLM